MSERLIAIDPGASGGIAYDIDGATACVAMPGTVKDIADEIKNLIPYPNNVAGVFCLIEKVGGYMPGNSGPAAAKFARHCGVLEGILVTLSVPFDDVLPAKWEQWLIGKPDYPKFPKDILPADKSRILSERKRERKNKIKEKVQRLYPHLNITLATADAVGILAYLKHTRTGRVPTEQ
jgi:hypothetical protein